MLKSCVIHNLKSSSVISQEVAALSPQIAALESELATAEQAQEQEGSPIVLEDSEISASRLIAPQLDLGVFPP
jgi:hypothetical protein